MRKHSLQLESCRRLSLKTVFTPQGAPETNATNLNHSISKVSSQKNKTMLERPRQWCSRSARCRDTILQARCTRRRLLRSYAALDHADEGKALVVVGSANADMVLQVNRLPVAGETLAAESLETFPGGKGANQAAAAGKLGHRTIFIGQVGEDSNAELLKRSLRDCGVDVNQLEAVAGSSGSAVVLLQPSGENSIIIVGGANTAKWEIGERKRQVLQASGALLLQREIPEAVNAEVAQIAAEAGVRVILDCGGAEGPFHQDILKHVSILSPNETELARLTGMPTDSRQDIEAAARQLLSQGVKESVLVKRGSSGSLLVTQDGAIEQGIFKADKVVDTTGAGDCYTGAYAVALLEGMEGKEAMAFAAAAAAVCVQRKGAMSSLPTRAELEQVQS